ncbi:MAG TPA: tetratricopeptide repeat protein [Thermoanaerobaculia bacterium]|nr:tetratricopeptide repeat protein [Thermoanaerobaculia bacterium]
MAQPATNPKIEELRSRLKADPKSRLFFPLAEELRKVDQLGEAEHVLRVGLGNHPTYLSAWVSLGRILREEEKNAESVEALNRALQLDPGNVVAARLLGDAYNGLGDKLEAIKKYKLVRALLPADEELDATIERLEEELNPVTVFNPPGEDTLRRVAGASPEPLDESPFVTDETQAEAEAAATITREQQIAQATGDFEPMHAAHAESPFEDPAVGATAASVTVEQPSGMHVEPAPLAADVATPWSEEESAADVFAPSDTMPGAKPDEGDTVTMAELYVRQGLPDKAREIYARMLERNPQNQELRAKLDALPRENGRDPKVARLERWLAKVKKREEGSVV